mmetsp:Transcript_70498/g.82128  ORF Transcript_70498/g.82128 Transcript_70498/m.82128 type:complete len:128 (+) Transcript_70498:35-418(+)
MFENILKDYEKQKKVIETNNEATKKKLKQLNEPLTRELLIHLNSQVFILHSNEQIIERETKNLRNECLRFYKEAKNWTTLYSELNESLKQIGDVVNWAKLMEDDLRTLVDKRKALKEAKEAKEQPKK